MASTALVTGGSGGIGNATARELATDHDVVVQYHTDGSGAERVVAEIQEEGGNATAVQCDVREPDAVAALFERARDVFGPVDVLVNNAGMAPVADEEFVERTPESIRRTLDVNLVGAMYCAQEVLEPMADRGDGRIVNVASTAGAHGSPSDPVYGASKGGLIAFTKSIAKRYTSEGVLSNAVAPSVTDTPMLPADRREAAREKFPMGRIVRPEEVAATVRYLVSDAYDSGKVIEVAGGRFL